MMKLQAQLIPRLSTRAVVLSNNINIGINVHPTLSVARSSSTPSFTAITGGPRASFSTSEKGKESPPPSSSPSISLYQYAICPFCNKAKALLGYANLKYDAIEVNPLTKY